MKALLAVGFALVAVGALIRAFFSNDPAWACLALLCYMQAEKVREART
jgi:hypothetical protein